LQHSPAPSAVHASGGDAISCLFEQITTWVGTLRPCAAGDFLSGVRTKLRMLQINESRHRTRRLVTCDGLDAQPGSIGPSGEELLASILEAAGEGLAASDAAVLYAARVLGLPLVEVAELTGISVRRLGRRRNHAVAFVVA
jgi:hypothetical protein